MEAEDLRYEKELLQWQLEKTAMRFDHMSTSGGPVPSLVLPPGEKFRLVEMGSKRDADHVNAKHAAIYPTEEDVSFFTFNFSYSFCLVFSIGIKDLL